MGAQPRLMRADYEQDVLELGERAADFLFTEELSRAYSELRARTWSMILTWYGNAMVQAPACAENWKPNLDENGMWHLPGEKTKA
jgi:hypothetical protein